MTTRLRRAAAAALILAALAASPAAAQPLPAVVVAPVALQTVGESAVFTGRVVARAKVDLRARVAGFVESVEFEEGARVAAGDVLFRIEDAEWRAVATEAEGALRSAVARLDLARIERDRQAELVAREAAAEAALDRAVAELGVSEGEVTRLEGALARAELQVTWSVIRAPLDGVVGLARADVGDLVGPESGALATVVATDPTTVEFPVPVATLLSFRAAVAAGEVAPSEAVSVRLPDGTQYAETGALDFIDVEVAPGSDTVLLRAAFANPDSVLIDGALVAVALSAEAQAPELTVPARAVQRDMQGDFALVVDAEGTVALRRIEVVRRAEGLAVIGAGLAEGEQVIVEGLNKARPGAKVDAGPAGG